MNKAKLKLSALAAIILTANHAWADKAYVNQNGDNGLVEVTQTGGVSNTNSVEVLQDLGSLKESAYLTQAGTGDQTVKVTQSGSSDVVTVNQNGTRGTTEITQGVHSSANTATVTQGVKSVDAYAFITQDLGSNSSAFINQNSPSADKAYITQTGDNNIATINLIPKENVPITVAGGVEESPPKAIRVAEPSTQSGSQDRHSRDLKSILNRE